MLFLFATAAAGAAFAQGVAESPLYTRRNSFGVLAAYSPNSSHILLGVAEKRKLWDFGVSYSRRIGDKKGIQWQYEAELLPIALVGDPLTRQVNHQTLPTIQTYVFNSEPLVSCAPTSQAYDVTDPKGIEYKGTIDTFCHGRKWTMGEAVSPVGLRTNFMVRRRIQPVFAAHIGYMYSTQAIPVVFAGSFNFAFDGGMGIEFFRSSTRSLRLEYRFHHISNHNSAIINPGIDNGLFQFAYVFGR